MARYRKVDSRIWNDAKFRSLSNEGKLAFLFVLTHPHMTALGAMRATTAGLAQEIGWSSEAFEEAFREALRKGMAKHDSEASFVWLPNFVKYNRPESPNVVRAWGDAFDLLPECELKFQLLQHVKDLVKALKEAFQEAFHEVFAEAFAKTMPYPDPEPEQEPEQEQDGCARGDGNRPGSPAKQSDPTQAGSVCLAMKAEGIVDVNPSFGKLLRLLEEGAETAEFVQAAKDSVAKGNPKFAYALGMVEGRRRDAAQGKPTGLKGPLQGKRPKPDDDPFRGIQDAFDAYGGAPKEVRGG